MAEGTQRRLAAIVVADVVGYSRLMGVDEEGTLGALKKYRRDLVDPKIADHNGRIVKTTGDGLLLEFPSVLDAVRCCVEVQQAMAEQTIDVPEDRQMLFRVGINIGDIIIDGEDIHGDGVNVAARLEALADPGGIALSDDAYRQVRDRLDIAWRDSGEHEVKNIARPIQVWRWSKGEGETATAQSADKPLALPDKPSIAVLPFDNMSGDPEQEYFSDGLTEDIITGLSRLRWLFVIARNSTFTYKGQAVDIKQAGRELGVRYVLEGSVRKAGQRVRVSAQLIEADTGNHIWAERYDRDLVDIFDLQDELTEAISANVNAELASSERELAHNKISTDLDAWDCYQRGMWHLYKLSMEELSEARQLFQLALEQAPEFANPYAALAIVALIEVIFGYSEDMATTLEEGLRNAERANALDDRDSYGHYALGRICTLLGDRDRAILALEKSVELNPSSALAHYGLGFAFYWFGRAEDAVPLFSLAIRLSPHDPMLWSFHYFRASAHFVTDNFDQVIIDLNAAAQAKSDEYLPYLSLASSFGILARIDEARAAYDKACKLKPDLSVKTIRSQIGTMHPPYLEKLLDGLKMTGLPEE